MKRDINSVCPQCGGTGIEFITVPAGDGTEIVEITCRNCHGVKYVSNSWLDDELIDMLNGMNDKIDTLTEMVQQLLDAPGPPT